MTPDIFLTLLIVTIAVALLFSERLRVDLVALLVLGALALSGLVTPAEALSGFSNPAVVTVWAVFIISGGLSRTGVANLVGQLMLRLAGRGEIRLIATIMVIAGVLSAFMNNVGVAAMLLPVVMHIAQRTGRSPSRLLMPLAYGSLLGGLATLIGTPPNILASDALREFGLQPFRLFDFAPMGVILMLTGTLFMALIGRHMLPERNVRQELVDNQAGSFRNVFAIQERLFVIKFPEASDLIGRTLEESRIGSMTGLTVIGILRNGQTQLSPGGRERLQKGDRLLVSGRLDRLEQLRRQSLPFTFDSSLPVSRMISEQVKIVEARLPDGSAFIGQTLHQIGFRQEFGANVLGIIRRGDLVQTDLQNTPLNFGDALLLQTPQERLTDLLASPHLSIAIRTSSAQQLQNTLQAIHIPADSHFVGQSLVESQLGDSFGLNVVGIIREGRTQLVPPPTEVIQAGDTLLVEGRREDITLISSLGDLAVEEDNGVELQDLESQQVGLVEVVLSPQTTLVGKTLRDLHFREKYGVNVLSIWRQGQAYRSNLRDMALRFGDALLIHGRRDRLKVLSREADYLVLSPEIQDLPRTNKAPLAGAIILAVVISVLIGWLPIAIAAVVGASLMILTGCLTMEEAYRYIEWRAVFLISGMLPLGIAMEKSGAARLLAGGVVDAVGPFGPLALIAGLFVLTAFASQLMPNPVVTVLMAPIAINTAANIGVSPYTLMMAVAISASASFLSPVGHPANVLVMGPGGYRFKDFFKVGLPLTVLILIITVLLLPIFWPIHL